MLFAALIVASQLHFSLPSGAVVKAGYGGQMTDREGRDIANDVAAQIWEIYCSARGPCGPAAGYTIDISIAPHYCIAMVQGKKYTDLEDFRCYFKPDDARYYVGIDQPDAPIRAPVAP